MDFSQFQYKTFLDIEDLFINNYLAQSLREFAAAKVFTDIFQKIHIVIKSHTHTPLRTFFSKPVTRTFSYHFECPDIKISKKNFFFQKKKLSWALEAKNHISRRC